jgi:hypothetical protein
MTPFFRNIENNTFDQMGREAEALILGYVSIGTSTQDNVREFVEYQLFRGASRIDAGNNIYLPHCDYYPQEMTCYTDESVVFSNETRWIIRFEFENDILTSVNVRLVVYGLH